MVLASEVEKVRKFLPPAPVRREPAVPNDLSHQTLACRRLPPNTECSFQVSAAIRKPENSFIQCRKRS
jgi:hypothetical protein